MASIRFVIVSITLLGVVVGSRLAAQELSLTIEVDKPVFVEGEPIYAVTTLKNHSSETKMYPPMSLGTYLSISVVESGGGPLPYKGTTFDYATGAKIERPLKPGAFVQRISDLQGHFYNCMEKGMVFPLQIIARICPGTYHLCARLRCEGQTIRSDTISITIIPPTGEDSLLFPILKEKCRLEYVIAKDNIEEKVQTFRTLTSQYRQSAYYPLMCQLLVGYLYQEGDTLEARDLTRYIMTSFPNSGLAMKQLEMSIRYWKERPEIVEEIKKIVPQSRVAIYGEQFLAK